MDSTNKFNSIHFINYLWKKKVLIIVLSIVITGIIGGLSFLLPDEYSSTISAVPPKSKTSMLQGILGNVSATLRDFGLTKLGGVSEGSYSFMVILDSRTVKDSIIELFELDKVYDIDKKKKTQLRKEFERNLEITYEPEGNYTITIWDVDPLRAANMVKAYFQIANNLAQRVFNAEARANREHLEQRLKQTDEYLALLSDTLSYFSKKNLIFSPEEQGKYISSALVDLKSELIKQEIVLELLKNRYGSDDYYTKLQQRLIDELRTKLDDAKNKPGFSGNFPLTEAGKVVIDYIRLKTEFETFSKVKAFLLPLLEESRLDEVREMQTLFIVDDAIPADKKSRPKRSLIFAGSFVGSLVLIIFILVLAENIRIYKRKLKLEENSES